MRKYFGLIILSLLIILVSCKVKNQGYDNEYYFYKGYNIVDKNLLVELDYSNNDYYLKFKEQVSLSLGELKFEGKYQIKDSDLIIDDMNFNFNKNKTLIELVYNDELLIFKKSNVELELESYEKEYFFEVNYYKILTLDFYKNQEYKLTYKYGDFPIGSSGKYYDFNNYIVIDDHGIYKLIEKYDTYINLNYFGTEFKLVTDGSDRLDEKIVSEFDYKYNYSLMTEFEEKINVLTGDNRYVLKEELLTNSNNNILYSYPDYKYYRTHFGEEYLYYESEYFQNRNDEYYGSNFASFSSSEFYKELDKNYQIYLDKENRFYLKIDYKEFVNTQSVSLLLSNYLYGKESDLYYEVIFKDNKIDVNIYNDDDKLFYKQNYERNNLEDKVDLKRIKQVSSMNLSDAIFPVILDDLYVIENSRLQNMGSYFKIDFKIGYYTIETSAIERYKFLKADGEEIYVPEIFSEYDNYGSNHEGNKIKFYVSEETTYYLYIDVSPYSNRPYYDYSLKVRHFDNVDLEQIDFVFDQKQEVIIDDIFFGKEIDLSFDEEKVIFFEIEAIGDSLYFEIKENGRMITGTYINKTYIGSLFVNKDKEYTLVFRRSAKISIKEGLDDNYETSRDNPFDLSNYDGETFVVGSYFDDDYFIFKTYENFYEFSSETVVKLEIKTSDGTIIKVDRHDNDLNLDIYILKSNEDYLIKASFFQPYLKYKFDIATLITGNVKVDSFPYNKSVYYQGDTLVSFDLKSKSLIYIDTLYGSLDLHEQDIMLYSGIEDVAIVLDAGSYQLKRKITREVHVDINIFIINDNTKKVSFNKGISLLNSINEKYIFEHEKEIYRIITKSHEKLSLEINGNARYYIKSEDGTSDSSLGQGYFNIGVPYQERPLELYVKGILNTETIIKLSYH